MLESIPRLLVDREGHRKDLRSPPPPSGVRVGSMGEEGERGAYSIPPTTTVCMRRSLGDWRCWYSNTPEEGARWRSLVMGERLLDLANSLGD